MYSSSNFVKRITYDKRCTLCINLHKFKETAKSIAINEIIIMNKTHITLRLYY